MGGWAAVKGWDMHWVLSAVFLLSEVCHLNSHMTIALCFYAIGKKG